MAHLSSELSGGVKFYAAQHCKRLIRNRIRLKSFASRRLLSFKNRCIAACGQPLRWFWPVSLADFAATSGWQTLAEPAPKGSWRDIVPARTEPNAPDWQQTACGTVASSSARICLIIIHCPLCHAHWRNSQHHICGLLCWWKWIRPGKSSLQCHSALATIHLVIINLASFPRRRPHEAREQNRHYDYCCYCCYPDYLRQSLNCSINVFLHSIASFIFNMIWPTIVFAILSQESYQTLARRQHSRPGLITINTHPAPPIYTPLLGADIQCRANKKTHLADRPLIAHRHPAKVCSSYVSKTHKNPIKASKHK